MGRRRKRSMRYNEPWGSKEPQHTTINNHEWLNRCPLCRQPITLETGVHVPYFAIHPEKDRYPSQDDENYDARYGYYVHKGVCLEKADLQHKENHKRQEQEHKEFTRRVLLIGHWEEQELDIADLECWLAPLLKQFPPLHLKVGHLLAIIDPYEAGLVWKNTSEYMSQRFAAQTVYELVEKICVFLGVKPPEPPK
jgi:hypothetical protein